MTMNLWEKPTPDFSELKGKTLTSITGMLGGSYEVRITCSDGSQYLLHHEQDCCESVSVESITGDPQDLIGTPILHAEESSSDKAPEGFTHEYEPDSQTWTFYKLATVKGWVDIRWFGSSNGYYSESVQFVRIEEPTA